MFESGRQIAHCGSTGNPSIIITSVQFIHSSLSSACTGVSTLLADNAKVETKISPRVSTYHNRFHPMAFTEFFKSGLKSGNTTILAKDHVTLDTVSDDAKQKRSNERNRYVTIGGWFILLLSYGFLVPGLMLPLYGYTVQGIEVYETMWTTIQMVNEDGGAFPAALLAFFGIAVPAIKLVLVALAHIRDLPWARRLVVWVSKWAIVDAIVACFIMAYFANALMGAVKSQIETGFIFFVLYCILSTVAALLLDDRDVEFRDLYATRTYLVDKEWVEKKSTSIYSLSATVALTCTALLLYAVSMGMGEELISMSVLSACHRLASEKNADVRPMILLVLFVVIVPLVELVFLGAMLYKPIDSFHTRCALRSLPQCGLLDVCAVAVLVMYIFLNKLGKINVEIPALGFTILCVAIVSTIFTRFVVGRYLGRIFGGSLADRKTTGLEREESSANSTIESGVSAVVV